MKTLIVIFSALSLAGCASTFTAKTKVSVIKGADSYTYESDKNQDIEYNPETGKLHVRAVTPDSVVAATLQSQQRLNEKMDALLGIMLKAAVAP